jgi:hypothetical protein
MAESKRERRLLIHPSLVELAGRNHEFDMEAWSRWVARLP